MCSELLELLKYVISSLSLALPACFALSSSQETGAFMSGTRGCVRFTAQCGLLGGSFHHTLQDRDTDLSFLSAQGGTSSALPVSSGLVAPNPEEEVLKPVGCYSQSLTLLSSSVSLLRLTAGSSCCLQTSSLSPKCKCIGLLLWQWEHTHRHQL